MIAKRKIRYVSIILISALAISVLFYLNIIDYHNLVPKKGFTLKENGQIININLTRKSKDNYLITADSYVGGKLLFTNSWPLKYDVFKIDTGDVNNDNATDILVGVIKSTRFDSISRKRLFIFKLFEGCIRPLWMGSRVSQPLVDFKFYKSKSVGIVRTIELEKDQLYLVAEYHWIGFGLGFINYLAREKTLHQAYKILNTN